MTVSVWRRYLHLDAALSATVWFRVLQGVSGLVTIALVGTFLSPELQGVYYTFLSFAALQTLGDLGLYIAIVSVASHEWPALALVEGQIAGDARARSRLVSLSRTAAIGYGLGGLLLTAGTWMAGIWFLTRTLSATSGILMPWSVLAALTLATFVASPLLGVLEACGQIVTVSRYRLVGAAASSLASWAMLVMGYGLWALPAAAGCLVLRDAMLIGLRYRRFFRPCFDRMSGPTVEWSTEIWPMQWRLALQGIAMYASTLMFTPLLMSVASPQAAGRFGMTWSAATGLQSLTLAWLQTRAPQLGHLAATGNDQLFLRLWHGASTRAIGALVLAGLALTGVVVWLNLSSHPMAARLLPPIETAVLMVGFCASQCVQAIATYLRARKQERLLASGVASSATAGVLAVLFAPSFGSAGVVAAYTIAMTAVALPVAAAIWARHRPPQVGR